MTRAEKAEACFTEGYNCCQSVVLAFEDLIPLDREMLLKASCPFGGGLARMREVCGCVCGMALTAGFLNGYTAPKPGEAKTEFNASVQEMAAEFRETYGAIRCGELLAPGTDAHKGPCKEMVAKAAAIVEKYLETKK